MWNNEEGEFVRYKSGFREWIKADGSTRFKPEAGRYHLYVSLACPWASRTLMVRKLRKLDDVISVDVVDPVWNENGWYFGSGYPGVTADTVNGKRDLIDVYRVATPGFDGVESVPILWDKKLGTIVNNESREIIRMLDHEFLDFGDPNAQLCPRHLEKQIDEAIDAIYAPINNGVYRAGFATHQRPYERAVKELFSALDHWEGVLSRQRYMCGDALTEADICLFTTLVRFDAVYVGHFKCNLRRIVDYPNLWNYVKDVYQTDGVAETVSLDHIKRHYYQSHGEINPTRIVPAGPVLDLAEPHDRGRFSHLFRDALGSGRVIV